MFDSDILIPIYEWYMAIEVAFLSFFFTDMIVDVPCFVLGANIV